MGQGRHSGIGAEAHKDIGCEKANIFLGVSESRCEWCPFHDCVSPDQEKGYSKNLKDLYENWEDMLRWTYANREVTYEQLGFLFSTRIETVRNLCMQ